MLAETKLKKEISGSSRRGWELAEAFYSFLADYTEKGKGICDFMPRTMRHSRMA
jgi:hypothetical protein